MVFSVPQFWESHLENVVTVVGSEVVTAKVKVSVFVVDRLVAVCHTALVLQLIFDRFVGCERKFVWKKRMMVEMVRGVGKSGAAKIGVLWKKMATVKTSLDRAHRGHNDDNIRQAEHV